MKHVIASVALLACVAALGATAHAQSPAQAPPAPPGPAVSAGATRVETHSYGLQIAGVDVAVLAGAAATKSSNVGVGGYLLGGPLVHLAHGHVGRALGSAALRAGLPVAGALLGGSLGDSRCEREDNPEELCGLEEMAAGLVIGAAAASLVDATVLAREEVEVPTQRAGLVQVGPISATPNVIASAGGKLSLGVTGSF